MIRRALLAVLLLAALNGPAAADAFFSVIDDLPLMPGFTENPNAAVTFETASGRIVEAAARGAAAPTEVRAFYGSLLPQLGWSPVALGQYQRDGEALRLIFEPDGNGGTVLSISLSPVKP